jgi:hypothetical protein
MAIAALSFRVVPSVLTPFATSSCFWLTATRAAGCQSKIAVRRVIGFFNSVLVPRFRPRMGIHAFWTLDTFLIGW